MDSLKAHTATKMFVGLPPLVMVYMFSKIL